MFSCHRVVYSNIPPLSATVVGVIFMMMAGSASANRVTLVATTNNQSILMPVSWAIFKLNDTSSPPKPVAELARRHSGVVVLPAGQYRATVTQETIVKETTFKVESNVDSIVRIALD